MIEIILDASQLDCFESCPRHWYYSYERNLIPNKARRAFDIGSYYHEVLAYHYLLYQSERSSLDPTLEQVPYLKDDIQRFQATIDFSSKSELLKRFGIYNLEEIKFHRQRLITYFNKYGDRDEAIQVIAVEKGFSYILFENESRRFILEGKIDLILSEAEGLCIMDHKTQSRKDNKWGYNHQVCNYLNFVRRTIDKEASYFIYNYIGLQEILPPDGLRRMYYKCPQGMLDQWENEVLQTFEEMYHMRLYIETYSRSKYKIDAYPRRRSACDSSKYGRCPFYKACSVPDGSGWEPVVLSAYKEKEERWSPWR